MAVDKRLPAVYVDIEDRSYVSEAIEAGRTAYCVIISDRGPHNQIVELNSRQDLYDLFGKPNFAKYGQGHYFVDQHLKRSGKIYVVRPVILEPIGDMTKDDCAAIANAQVYLNQTNEKATIVEGNFKFVGGSNIVVPTNPDGEPEIMPRVTFRFAGRSKLRKGDYFRYIYNSVDSGQLELSQANIDDINSDSGWTMPDGLHLQYDEDEALITITCPNRNDVVTDAAFTIMPREAAKDSRSGVVLDTTGTGYGEAITFGPIIEENITVGDTLKDILIDEYSAALGTTTTKTISINITYDNIDSMKVPGGYYDRTLGVRLKFENGSLSITRVNTSLSFPVNQPTAFYDDYDKPELVVGVNIDYIPAIDGMTPGLYSDITSDDYLIFKSFNGTDEVEYKYKVVHVDERIGITISEPSVESYAGPIKKISDVGVGHITRMISKKNIDSLDENILWNFYTIGAGSYYNSLYIKGVRNSVYDRMYTTEDGEAEYPYAFMDVAIYRDNGDGTTTLMEGPWTVSLMEKTAKEVVIKDIYTGLQMYLPTVINRKSKLIRVEESRAVDYLTTMNMKNPFQPDIVKRQKLQNLISGKMDDHPNGIQMAGGMDGNMFDSMGRLNSNETIKSIVMQAYNGSLPSEDGSIQRLLSVIYPWYLIDYIYCGGWDHNVNHAALELAELRNDCLLLSDTGAYKESHDEDIEARRDLVSWNTWNAALYTNYRKIFDDFTSKYFYISPIYHAIDRHLYVDDLYWIAEPVAGIEKGAIEEAIELAYGCTETQLADEIDAELNPVLVESDGTYILQQFTTWKRLSVMKRQHVVKFVQYCKKKLPGILKDILHRKATTYWLSQAESRVNSFMTKFVDTGGNDRYAAISYFSSQVSFDEEASELNVILTIHPLRSIERINVSIIVT